ncbi:transcriptional repressor [Gordonia phage Dolores]|uniref:Immunity repressor n=1 Tax=Gordonia phage Dolores TaxID=2873534 RepID=A0AAE8XB99_9CAUD|nr:transcriptional repressor [Gordonia phage Dolores]UAJ16475.1 immunity repressor [Gordonia phage Dolores]URM87977.1 immunity repressor [Gordonia phage WinkNick]
MSATRLDELLQGVIDDRKAKGLPAAYRDIEELVKAEEASSPRGLSLNRQTVSEIVTRRYKKTPQEGTLRAIAWLAGVPDEVAFTAAGKRVPGPPFAAELPPGVDELEDDERKAAIAVLRALVAQRREINRYVDSSTGTQEPRTPRKARKDQKTDRKPDDLPTPDQGESPDDYELAGRDVGGISEGESTRRRMDDQAEAPDSEGPEAGA